MKRSGRVIQVLVLVFLLFITHWLRDQLLFEAFLDSLNITFDDFPIDYSQALKTHVKEHHPLQYDNYSAFAALGSTSRIPPTIHFIWFKDLYNSHLDVSKIPTAGSRAPEYCRNSNPSYAVNIWNATAARDLLQQHYAWFLPTYDGYIHPIQRVDAFKYFVLLHYGGIYMDLDIACRRPLDPLLEFPAWFPKATPFGLNNDLMASHAHHPLIRRMTETLKSRDKSLLFPYLTIFWSTGPQFTSDLVKMWYHNLVGKRYVKGTSKVHADPEDFFVLPLEFYSEEYTFFGHSPGGTWHGDDVAVVLWFVDRLWLVLLLATTLVGVCLMLVLRRKQFKSKGCVHYKLLDV